MSDDDAWSPDDAGHSESARVVDVVSALTRAGVTPFEELAAAI